MHPSSRGIAGNKSPIHKAFSWPKPFDMDEKPKQSPNSSSNEEDLKRGDREIENSSGRNTETEKSLIASTPGGGLEGEKLSRFFSGRTWLQHQLLPPYWNTHYEVVPQDAHSRSLNSNFVREWERYLENSGVINVADQHVILSERLVIKEVLWMLQGIKDLYLFHWDGSKFIIRKPVQLFHLTQGTLDKMLKEFGHYGTMVVNIRTFVHNSVIVFPNTSSQTVQMFAYALSEFLQLYLNKLTSFEKRLIDQKDIFTLEVLWKSLQSHMEEISILADLVHEVTLIDASGGASHQAVYLLSVLQDYVEKVSLLGLQEFSEQLLQIFLKTCKPYTEFVEQLITTSELSDPYKEFIVQRNHFFKEDNHLYWKNAFLVTVDPKELSDSFFLKPFLNSIILAGKSIELLKKLKSTVELGRFQEKKSFYHCLVDYFQMSHLYQKCFNASSGTDSKIQGILASVQKSAEKWLGNTNDRNIIPTQLSFKSSMNLETYSISAKNKVVRESIHQAVFLSIHYRCAAIGAKFLDVFKSDNKLSTHLQTVQQFFFMFAGDVMFSFCSELFCKILAGAPWHNVSFLNTSIQDALLWRDAKEAQMLSVALCSNVPSRTISSSFEDITLIYNAPWPVSFVLNAHCMDIYNKVFQFLLNIKFAKFVVDELRLKDLRASSASLFEEFEVPVNQKMHALFLLRMRLIYVINNIHTFIVTDVLHKNSIKFMDEIDAAGNLDEVISAHIKFLEILQEGCFLTKQFGVLHKICLEMISLSLDLKRVWSEDVAKIKVEQIRAFQSKFNNWYEKICTFLMLSSTPQTLQLKSLYSGLENQRACLQKVI